MKRSRFNIALIVIVILAILGIAAYYLYDIFYCHASYKDNLFRVITTMLVLLGVLIRLLSIKGRKKLAVYEKAYEEELGYAFQNRPSLRKKLLCACRLYDESNYAKALKYLFALLRKTEFERDCIPVLLFMALCYSDADFPDDAINVYHDLLKYDPKNAHAHNNLGSLYISLGKYDMALQHFNKSIECNSYYHVAYLNRANYYFRIREYDNAAEDAKKVLEINNNSVEAASLLTIIFALKNDEENKKKYYHIAITLGEIPEELDAVLDYFLN